MDLSQLPDLIVHNILSHLSTSPTQLSTLSLVCKQWNQQSKNATWWRNLLFKLPKGKLGESVYGKGSSGGIDYKRIYTIKSMGERWQTSVSPVVLNGHKAPVVCLDYDGKFAISGSAEGQMKVWNVDSGECMKTFHQHTAAVRGIQFDESKIISVAEDQTIRIWKMSDGTVSIMEQFKYSLRSLRFEGNTLVCGGINPIISVLDIPTCKTKFQLKGHTAAVYTVDLRGHMAVSGGVDNTVRVWDVRMAQCVSSLAIHEEKLRGVQLVGHLLASGSEDKTVKFTDTRKMAPVDTFDIPAPVNGMLFDGLRLAVATSKGLYITSDGSSMKTISVPQATCARFTSKSPTIVAGYMDYHVSVMDFYQRGRKRKKA